MKFRSLSRRKSSKPLRKVKPKEEKTQKNETTTKKDAVKKPRKKLHVKIVEPIKSKPVNKILPSEDTSRRSVLHTVYTADEIIVDITPIVVQARENRHIDEELNLVEQFIKKSSDLRTSQNNSAISKDDDRDIIGNDLHGFSDDDDEDFMRRIRLKKSFSIHGKDFLCDNENSLRFPERGRRSNRGIVEHTFDPRGIHPYEEFKSHENIKFASQLVLNKTNPSDRRMSRALSKSGESIRNIASKSPGVERKSLGSNNYATPSQRCDEKIRNMKKLYHDLNQHLELTRNTFQKEKSNFAGEMEDYKKSLLKQIENEKTKQKQLFDTNNALRLSIASSEQKYESTNAQYELLEKNINHENIALQEWFLIMYEKGKTTIQFENHVEFKLGNDTDINFSECRKEFVLHIREMKKKLKKWKHDRLQEHYETFNLRISSLESRYGKTKIVKLGFIKDSLLHFLLARNDKEAYMNLTMLLNLFRFTGTQLKMVIASVIKMQKEGFC